MKQPRKNQHDASAHGTRARSNRTWSCWTLHVGVHAHAPHASSGSSRHAAPAEATGTQTCAGAYRAHAHTRPSRPYAKTSTQRSRSYA